MLWRAQESKKDLERELEEIIWSCLDIYLAELQTDGLTELFLKSLLQLKGLLTTYSNHLCGNLTTLLPPLLPKVLVALLRATDPADTVDSHGVSGAGQDHAGGGDVGPTVKQSKK